MTRSPRIARELRLVVASLALVAAAPGYAEATSRADDGWDFNRPPAALRALCDRIVDEARAAFRAIEEDTAPPTVGSVYGAFDELRLAMQPIQHAWYLMAVHPDTSIQAAAEDCVERFGEFMVDVDLSRRFYGRVAAIDLDGASAAEKLMVQRRLRAFRHTGVDRDKETRDRVQSLQARIIELGAAFDRNIRTDQRFVDARPEQLAGLPRDFLATRPPDERGLVRISTDYPDFLPVMTYSANDELKRALYTAARRIATPANEAVLTELIRKRHELATLVGYRSYAALAMDGYMVVSPRRAQDFLARVGAAVEPAASREMELLLARLQRASPGAERVEVWQAPWLLNQLRQEEYALDTREVRRYFHYDRVRDGLFRLTEDLFGVEIVPWETITWHDDVSAWEIRERGAAVGRFYLDMHPRANKYRHAAHWTLRKGLKGRQLPISGIATNFPRGLMEHAQVETFLHEFGHLLHNMFAGGHRWLDVAGMSMEADFIEAPSQMLEEWVWDYDTLKTFARDDSGKTIPRSLVAKMLRSRYLGEATRTATQLFYARLALDYFNREPDSFEPLPLMRQLQAQYSPYPYVPDTHFYNNFSHLNGYSSNYYMYQWSRAIAEDMLGRFRDAGLRDERVARDFRRKVLAAAGSRRAAASVEDFLGRPFDIGAYQRHLSQLSEGTD